MKQEKLVFPKGFLWGSAVSAHQVEGNNTNSDWWAWENSEKRIRALKQKGKDPQNFRSGRACDFYNRYKADFDLAKSLNHNAFRLSIEWARVQPQQGQFSDHELQHYKDVLQAAKSHGLKTFVTLHHFTNPFWFAQIGGFEKRENVPLFLEYVKKTVTELDQYADFWITINEPEMYCTLSYSIGVWPPQKKNPILALRVARNLILAHNEAKKQISEVTKTPVGLAYHLSDLQPANIFSKLTTLIVNYVLNEFVLKRTIRSCDYIGVNYYMHHHVGMFGFLAKSMSQHMTSDLGWGVHPEGIERVLLKLKKFRKPIYITENGIADAADTRRGKFIKDHLCYLYRAIKKGVDVRGYLYWSLVDNFEWADGFAPRFGLVEVDYKTQSRRIRKSALAYAQICKTNELIYRPLAE